jgi:dTDP-4-amino-4,6-dideoxygalactose transaminase
MLNIQAALGVSQIDELERFVEIKRLNYKLYAELLEGAQGLHLLPPPEGQRWNHWFYSLYIDDEDRESGGNDTTAATPPGTKRGQDTCGPGEGNAAYGVRRDRVMKALIAKGVQCRPVWKLVHTQEPYKQFRAKNIECAHDYEKHILNLPCSTTLTESDIRHICKLIPSASF